MVYNVIRMSLYFCAQISSINYYFIVFERELIQQYSSYYYNY